MFSKRCGWCREGLVRVRAPWLLRLLGLGLFRLYHCPHCHEHFVRFFWFRPPAKSAAERLEQHFDVGSPSRGWLRKLTDRVSFRSRRPRLL